MKKIWIKPNPGIADKPNNMTKFKDVAHLYLDCEVVAVGKKLGTKHYRLVGASVDGGLLFRTIPEGFSIDLASDWKPLLRPLDSMTEEEAIGLFKMVSLFDLSECKFEFGEKGERWVNAIFGGRVIDSIKFIGDNIEMMNNDGTFSAVNPFAFIMSYYLSKGFDLFGLIPNGEAIDKTKI